MAKTEHEFQQWLSWASIYINTDRYSSFGDGVVCVIDYDHDDKLQEAVDNLDAGDNDMIDACDYIRSKPRWMGAGGLLEAVKAAENVARKYYFDELNNHSKVE